MKQYKSLITNHQLDYPVQYQKGYVEFYKLKFKVTPDVLIPRPETELLVDEVLSFLHTYLGSDPDQQPTLNKHNPKLVQGRTLQANMTILDIGTGCGAIAIALAKNLVLSLKSVRIKITATDVSEKALAIALQNAKLHGVEHDITFSKSDLLSSLSPSPKPDVVVTNLPYIPSERIAYLDPSVKDYEPHVALDGGSDGFELYRKLFQQIKEQNWHPKLILGEIDYTHGEIAAIEAQRYFPEAVVEIKKDLTHLQRILFIRFA